MRAIELSSLLKLDEMKSTASSNITLLDYVVCALDLVETKLMLMYQIHEIRRRSPELLEWSDSLPQLGAGARMSHDGIKKAALELKEAAKQALTCDDQSDASDGCELVRVREEFEQVSARLLEMLKESLEALENSIHHMKEHFAVPPDGQVQHVLGTLHKFAQVFDVAKMRQLKPGSKVKSGVTSSAWSIQAVATTPKPSQEKKCSTSKRNCATAGIMSGACQLQAAIRGYTARRECWDLVESRQEQLVCEFELALESAIMESLSPDSLRPQAIRSPSLEWSAIEEIDLMHSAQAEVQAVEQLVEAHKAAEQVLAREQANTKAAPQLQADIEESAIDEDMNADKICAAEPKPINEVAAESSLPVEAEPQARSTGETAADIDELFFSPKSIMDASKAVKKQVDNGIDDFLTPRTGIKDQDCVESSAEQLWLSDLELEQHLQECIEFDKELHAADEVVQERQKAETEALAAQEAEEAALNAQLGALWLAEAVSKLSPEPEEAEPPCEESLEEEDIAAEEEVLMTAEEDILAFCNALEKAAEEGEKEVQRVAEEAEIGRMQREQEGEIVAKQMEREAREAEMLEEQRIRAEEEAEQARIRAEKEAAAEEARLRAEQRSRETWGNQWMKI